MDVLLSLQLTEQDLSSKLFNTKKNPCKGFESAGRSDLKFGLEFAMSPCEAHVWRGGGTVWLRTLVVPAETSHLWSCADKELENHEVACAIEKILSRI